MGNNSYRTNFLAPEGFAGYINEGRRRGNEFATMAWSSPCPRSASEQLREKPAIF
jgi:hypothetical protein